MQLKARLPLSGSAATDGHSSSLNKLHTFLLTSSYNSDEEQRMTLTHWCSL